MELWIRSQDKMKLLKCESLVIDNTCPEMESVGEYCICDSFERHIAKYKSKERALEVLDEIQKIFKPQLMIKDSGKIIGTFETTIIKEGATYELKELSTYVYEMPKE